VLLQLLPALLSSQDGLVCKTLLVTMRLHAIKSGQQWLLAGRLGFKPAAAHSTNRHCL